jgi:hypothetical protein
MGGRKEGEESAFLDRMSDFLGSSDGLTKDEVREELVKEGVDVDGLLNRCFKMMAEKEGSLKPDWREQAKMKRERGERLFSDPKRRSELENLGKDKLLEIAMGFIASGELVASYGRNLEEMSEETLRSIIMNLEKMRDIEAGDE